MMIRRAALSDWALLFYLKNDPDSLAQSGDARTIPLDEHMEWLRDALDSPDRCTVGIACRPLSAAFSPGVGVGVVRVQRSRAEFSDGIVSVAISPHWRGNRASYQMIQWAAQQAPGLMVTRLVARVRQDNFPSLRAFASCLFVPTGEVDGPLVTLERKL